MLRLTAIIALTLTAVFAVAPLSLAQIGTGATLVVLGGGVTVQSGGASSAGSTGQSLGAGDQVSTSANGRALITFFDGSEVELDSNAALQIAEVTSAGTQTRIGLNAIAGSSVHKVVSFSDPGSAYRVSAGTSVLLVRGTLFGHHTDPASGDVTMALAECGRTLLDPQDCVDFPAPGQRVRVGEKVTLRRDGSLVRGTFTPGSSLLNEVKIPAGTGGVIESPAVASFKSADDCIQQKAVAEGMPFGDALAACALALAPPTPTPTTPSAPAPAPAPPPPPPPVIVAAAIDTNTALSDGPAVAGDLEEGGAGDNDNESACGGLVDPDYFDQLVASPIDAVGDFFYEIQTFWADVRRDGDMTSPSQPKSDRSSKPSRSPREKEKPKDSCRNPLSNH